METISSYNPPKTMSDFFALEYHGAPFVLFGRTHLIILAVAGLVTASPALMGKRLNTSQRRGVRYGLAGLLVVNELSLHVWLIYHHQWSVMWNLPLHMCTVFVWLSALMLLTRGYAIFEFAYFLGIGGAMQALFTPDAATYGFPHFYLVQFFISHTAVITATVYMAAVEGYRPYPSSIKKVFLWGNIYLIFVTLLNLALGSNYLYTLHKPHVPTLLDVMGPWPWYLLSGEFVALLVFLLLYLPYFLADRKRGRKRLS